jgi:hypothetical protein
MKKWRRQILESRLFDDLLYPVMHMLIPEREEVQEGFAAGRSFCVGLD